MFQMQNIRFQSSGMRRKQVFLAIINDTRHLAFVFFLPLYFRFSCPIFFLCWKFSRLHFGGKSFWQSFNGRRIWCKEVHVGSGTRFWWDFLGQLRALFCRWCCFAFSPTSLTESCSFWHGMKDVPCTSQMTKTSLTVFNDDVTSGTRNVEQNELFFSHKPNLADDKVSWQSS